MLDAGVLEVAPEEEIRAADAADRLLRVSRRRAGLSDVAGLRVPRI